MSEWRISKALEEALVDWIEQAEAGWGAFGYPYYPAVMWSLGGEASLGDNRIELPPKYSVGVYRREPPPTGDRLLYVPSERFDLVIFLPKDEDLASNRRLIDFDGENIVVR